MAKLTNKQQTDKINQLIQTVITLHNSLTQLGQFVNEYISYKGDTSKFQSHIDKLIAGEQEKSEGGNEDAEGK